MSLSEALSESHTFCLMGSWTVGFSLSNSKMSGQLTPKPSERQRVPTYSKGQFQNTSSSPCPHLMGPLKAPLSVPVRQYKHTCINRSRLNCFRGLRPENCT